MSRLKYSLKYKAYVITMGPNVFKKTSMAVGNKLYLHISRLFRYSTSYFSIIILYKIFYTNMRVT